MTTVKKLTGELEGYNIRKTNDGKYHGYRGNVCVTKPKDTEQEVITALNDW